MKLIDLKNAFVKDEDGAVTVDWVVLTAAIVGIGLVVLALVRDGVGVASSAINAGLLEAATF